MPGSCWNNSGGGSKTWISNWFARTSTSFSTLSPPRSRVYEASTKSSPACSQGRCPNGEQDETRLTARSNALNRRHQTFCGEEGRAKPKFDRRSLEDDRTTENVFERDRRIFDHRSIAPREDEPLAMHRDHPMRDDS